MQITNLSRSISVIGAFALALTTARAVDPPPDGGYPGGNTAEGDNALLNLDTSQGTSNTAVGFQSLFNDTTGFSNTASGYEALFNNTTGGNNTANGLGALFSNTTGGDNTATGWAALQTNTTGIDNTATGFGALFSNTTASSNTADGWEALFNNTTGYDNTATGATALLNNTTGSSNTANGQQALFGNTAGGNNTATGAAALFSNSSGGDNTATGVAALAFNSTGFSNTATGLNALISNTTGSNNTATGDGALQASTTAGSNLADGYHALDANTTGSFNIAIGNGAGGNLTTGNNNIDIGNNGVAAESSTIRIGTTGTQTKTFLAAVRGVAIGGGMPVAVSASGQLGVRASSARFKEAIKPMDKASEAIFSLQPVTFRYKKALDPEALPQFGLVAEQVARVDPDLVACGVDGKPYTVRYEEVNAMLLNEFLKEHRTVQELKSTVAKQEATIARQQEDSQITATQQRKEIKALTASLKEQASQIAKVSVQIEANKPAPQMVAENQ